MAQAASFSLFVRLVFHPAGVQAASQSDFLFTYPDPVHVSIEKVPVEAQQIPQEAAHTPAGRSLDVLLLLPGSDTSFRLQEQAEDWVGQMSTPSDALDGLAIDMPLRGGRIQWRASRVVVQAPGDQFDDLSAAIAGFAWLWLDTKRVQNRLEAEWPRLSDDSGELGRAAFGWSKGRMLGERAAQSLRDRQWVLRAMLALENGDKALSRNARRIFFELCHQLEMSKRLALLGDVVEACHDVYEPASERAFEFRLFVMSSVLEAAILAGILAEIVLLLVRDL